MARTSHPPTCQRKGCNNPCARSGKNLTNAFNYRRYCSDACQQLAAQLRRQPIAQADPATVEETATRVKELESMEVQDLRTALRRQSTALRRAKAKSEDLIDAVYRASYDAAIVLGPAPKVERLLSVAVGPGNPEIALLHATDWQFGKRTETYDRAKCEERVQRLGRKVELLTNIQRAEHPVDECHVMFGGDMLESLNIFPGQAYEVDGTMMEQLFGVARLMENLIRQLLSVFPRVVVWSEEGNHGRLGRKGEWPRTDNTDIMAYETARRALMVDYADRLTWHPRKTWYQSVTVGNYHAMLIHGDEIKNFGGNIPAFGLVRKGTAWSSGVADPFRDIYFGHYHTHMDLPLPNGGRMFGSGSTESDNIYAAEFVAAKGLPSQRLHYIDPRRGRVTCEYKVHLTDDEG
jgi:hypothetical protein